MKRIFFSFLALASILSFAGCASTVAKIDGTSEEELKIHTMGKDRYALEQLKIENQRLQGRIDTLEGSRQEKRGLEKEIRTLREQVDSQRAEKSVYADKINRLETEKDALQKQVVALEQEKNALETKAAQQKPEQKGGKFTVKVLGGNGDILSAKQMAARLKKLGYRVERVDLAPRKTFKQNTVFFSPDLETEAGRLAAQIGGSAVTKRLTWSSAFDFIVVTGRIP